MEEYLTIDELSERIKFSKQSLYNFIYKGTFVLGKHYLKPTRKKILFKWSEILIWLGEDAHIHSSTNAKPELKTPNDSEQMVFSKNRIRI